MQIKLNAATCLHVLAIIGQILNGLNLLAPPKYQFAIAGAIGIVQTVVGVIQHYSPAPNSVSSKLDNPLPTNFPPTP